MLAAAGPVLSGLGHTRGHIRGRHRKSSQGRDGWLCLAAQILDGWAPTLRVCVPLAVTGAVVAGAILSSGPAIGASVGTFISGLGLLAAWTVRARRAPEPQP
jgi:hypothetical protein